MADVTLAQAARDALDDDPELTNKEVGAWINDMYPQMTFTPGSLGVAAANARRERREEDSPPQKPRKKPTTEPAKATPTKNPSPTVPVIAGAVDWGLMTHARGLIRACGGTEEAVSLINELGDFLADEE